MASGNPSFMCKGKTPSKKLVKLMHDSNYCGGASGARANFGGIFSRQIAKGQPAVRASPLVLWWKKSVLFFLILKGTERTTWHPEIRPSCVKVKQT